MSSSSLSRMQLNRRMLPTLDAIDKLQLDDAESTLPKIVVVGDQSDGKSTVLEAIAGVSLPKGAGMCTRCPIQIRIRSADEWSATVRSGRSGIAKAMKNPRSFEQALRDEQNQLLSKESDKSVSETTIEATVCGPDLANLTLLDLPGINRKKTNEEITLRLIKQHIANPNAVIVVVFKAINDLDSSTGWQLAREVDTAGKRSVLVMSHCDGDFKNKETSIAEILDGDELVFPVSCHRSHGDDRTRAELLHEERKFFESQPLFSRHPRCGIEELQSELVGKIFNVLAPLSEQVFQRVLKKKREAAEEVKLQERSEEHLQNEMTRRLCHLKSKLDEQLTGTDRYEKNVLYSECKKAWEKFAEDAENTATDFLESKVGKCVHEEYDGQAGREIAAQTNLFPVTLRVTKKLISVLEEKSEHMRQSCETAVRNHTRCIVSQQLQQFPLLHSAVSRWLTDTVDECCRKAGEMVNEAFEMEKIVFTNDSVFRKLTQRSAVAEPNKRVASAAATTSSQSTLLQMHGGIAAMSALLDGTVPGVNVLRGMSLLRDAITMSQSAMSSITAERGSTQPQQLDSKSEEKRRLLEIVRAYVGIATRRVADNVPLMMTRYLLHGLTDRLHTLLHAQAMAEAVGGRSLTEDPRREEKLKAAKQQLAEWRLLLQRLQAA